MKHIIKITFKALLKGGFTRAQAVNYLLKYYALADILDAIKSK